MLKYAGTSVINAILSPNEDTKKAIDALFSHFWRTLNSPSISTKTTDKEGKEIEIKISPLDMIVSRMGEILWIKIRGSTGAVRAEANRVEAGLAQALGGLPMPRKGQTTNDFIMEQLAARLMPTVEQKLSSWIDNKFKGTLPKGKEGWP